MLRSTALAACATALLGAVSAHIGIDVLGDFLVRDDTYDHLAHGSRELFTFAALGLGITAGFYLFSHLFAAAASLPLRARMLRVRSRHVAAMVASIVALTLLFVPVMETIDALRAGGDVDTLSDAFGGSLVLGIGTTLACALLWCGAVLGIVAWLVHHRERVARLFIAFLQFRRASVACARERRAPAAVLASAPARRKRHRSKRGPPSTAALVLVH